MKIPILYQIQKRLDKRALEKKKRLYQLDQSLDFFQDRREEAKKYLQVSDEEIDKGLEIMKERMNEAKDVRLETDKDVYDFYRNFVKESWGILSPMLTHTRLDSAIPLGDFLNKQYPAEKRSTVRTLDYGCGISDYGIVMATHGYNVTLCDIEGATLDFTQWRYKERGLNCSVLQVNEENKYPKLENFDMVVIAETLEHIRDPLTVVKNVYAGLNDGGYLWVSSYPFVEEYDVGGSHRGSSRIAAGRFEVYHRSLHSS